MCLHTDWDEPKEAEKDIICYKTLEKVKDKLFSIHQNFHYETDKEYMLNPDDLVKFFDGSEASSMYYKRDINLGFHSYKYVRDIRTWRNLIKWRVMAKCKIPKGALYYKGCFGDVTSYCSNKIIITEIR